MAIVPILIRSLLLLTNASRTYQRRNDDTDRNLQRFWEKVFSNYRGTIIYPDDRG
ncbi:MAG: hypothetical protein ABWU13_06410 [Limnospira maxima]